MYIKVGAVHKEDVCLQKTMKIMGKYWLEIVELPLETEGGRDGKRLNQSSFS
jgi:hypothetical protein